MRCEAEIDARVRAAEYEIRSLNAEITKLSLQVKLGGDGWRTALEDLSHCIERRRALHVQLDSLHWVLASELERRAG